MGCRSRRREVEVRPEQKWDYISLNDFKSNSCFTPFAYGYLWFSLILSIAIYAVDTFTAVNLLAFSRWSGTINPTQKIPFEISRWIFSICIILSFINLGFEHIRAKRVMNRGSVAECYLDNLAVRLESIRFKTGWKRFLVFAELTKGKKGAEYVALFTYFGLQSWIRVVVCSGPRQVVNALTLYSIYTAKLEIEGANFESSLMSFFAKIKALALQDYQQALVLSGMIFTLFIWVFSFLAFLLSVLFFIFFLWHYIPRDDGGLSGYCERKANKRLMRIVSIKINKAMADDERRRKKAEFKAARKNGADRPVSMKATLPNVGDDALPTMPMMGRNDTTATLPQYTSRPTTPGSFEMSSIEKRPYQTRTATMSSATSGYSARQPLVGAAAELGYNRSASPAPSLPSADLNGYPPVRTATMTSNRSYGQGAPLSRMNTNGSGFGGGYTASPATYSSDTMPAMPPLSTAPSYRTVAPTPLSGRLPYDDYASSERSSPAPSMNSFRGNPLSPRGVGPNGQPIRSATNPTPVRGPGGPPYPPERNMTAPVQPRHQPTFSNGSARSASSGRPPYPPDSPDGEYDYFNRPSTANSQRSVPRPRYNGWVQDPERGHGARY